MSPNPFANDVATIGRIDAVKSILEVVCRTTGLGFSAVARVTDTHWVACAVRDEINFGLQAGGELDLKTTICNEIRDSGQIVTIDHVKEDPRFCNHHTPAKYGFQSYISVPIRRPSGEFFGTLCAIDPKPARVGTPEIIGMFTLFADLIGQHLDAQERMHASDSALTSEREASQLREQFIAVLGHDLRNPLAAISVGADLLRRTPGLPPTASDVVGMIKLSAGRMSGLINNLMDFARGRLGGGLGLNLKSDDKLSGTLRHVIDELQATSPSRVIHKMLDLQTPVYCDAARIGQLLSNLIANALTHGAADSPVNVRAQSDASGFELSVTNRGQTIPQHIVENLFQPFARGKERAREEGLGLGLYIAAEIARAHGGELSVLSEAGETCFAFRMPTAT